MTTLIDGLQQGLHTTCQCWRIARSDGHVLRLTEHDRQIAVDGDTYSPGVLIDSGTFTLTSDLTPGTTEIKGALDHDAIQAEEVSTGIWDGARIDVFRADWKSGERIAHIWSGRLGRVEIEDGRFSAELLSLKSDFSRLVGRAYTRQCDAVLGDARCGVDLSDPAFQGKVCDQKLETCAGTFGNAESFRGFPHMPGSDFLLAGPAAERTQ